MVRRKNRLTTDAVREVRHTLGRFISILVLSALAVAFLAGLRAAAPDMEYTADNYYDRTNLMDGYVLSTLGLTEDDLAALAAADGVADVEGGWSVDAISLDAIVTVRSMPERINLLDVDEGRLPEAADECVTERLLLVELGLDVGDTLSLTMGEGSEDDLVRQEYTIVGVVNSPLYVGTNRGSSSLGSGSVDGFVYIPGENFTYDYYTVAYLVGDGLVELDSYGDEYEDRMEALIDSLDGLAGVRAQLRYDTLIGDAQAELDDAQAELDEAKAEAEQELADAWRELEDARKKLDEGWADYYEGESTLDRETADARQQLADAAAQLDQAQKDYDAGVAEYNSGLAKYEDGLTQYQNGLASYEDGLAKYEDGLTEYEAGKAQYEAGLAEYEAGKAQYEDGLAQYEAGRTAYETGLAEYEAGLAEYEAGLAQYQAALEQYEANKTLLDSQQEQLDAGYAEYYAALEPYVDTPYYDAVVAQLAEQKAALDAAQAQLDEAYLQLAQGKAQLDATEVQLTGAKAELDAAQAELDEARAELDGAQAKLDESKAELDGAQAELDEAKAELDKAKAELDEAKAELDEAKAELDDAQAELNEAQAELTGAQGQLNDAKTAIADGWEDYNSGAATLDREEKDGLQKLADARRELEDGETEYADGLREYEDGKAEADAEIADAQAELDDARQELDEVQECEWYVLGRNTNVGFVGYSQDAERVANLANIFPVIFFLVAALACLTTMTRMVEEQRTQIGSLKALGFSRLAISKKYIGYAFVASLLGGILGLALGATTIPAVIANAFDIMYNIPKLEFKRQTLLCVVSVFAAVACTTGAALWACLSTLMDTPANLMRPKAPKAGRRVFLEYIKPLWSHLSFTWKVTMRNLFRYQRRFWMTVIGIGGCTALIVTGFGLHESIFDILNIQFDEISLYDATVGLDEKITAAELAAVEDYLAGSDSVEDYLISYQSTADASNGGTSYSVTLSVVEDQAEFTRFIDLRHRKDDQAVTIPEEGVIITEKLSELLDVKVGDTITIEGDRRVTAPIQDIVENYVYHYVYLSDDYYAQLFGEDSGHNIVMVRYQKEAGADESNQVSAALMALDGVSAYSYIATLRDTFTNSMNAINYAVIIIILAAAALAFVVLYNLTNINITERTRELATLKVLGFYDRETTAYVYRENIFLTAFGIALGLVLGRLLHAWMIVTVEVSIVMFGRTAPPYAYILAAVLTVVFSVIVNIAAHFKLKKVDMVESLKSVE